MASQSEIYRLCAEIRKRWPHGDMPDVDQYHRILTPFGAHQISAAIDALDREGAKFAPRPTEISQRLAQAAVDAPEWGTAVSELRARQVASGKRARTADRSCPAGQCDGTGIVELDSHGNPIPSDSGIRPVSSRRCVCHEQLLRETATEHTAHPVIAMFLTQCDQRKISSVLDGDSTDYAQMKREYDAYVQRLHKLITHIGIDPAGLPELQHLAHDRTTIGLAQSAFTKQITEGEAA